MTIWIPEMIKFYFLPLFYLLEPSVTYFSILADFQNSVANVQKLCFYLLIPPKDLLDRFEILSDHSQTSRISLGVFNIFNILRRSVTTQYLKMF